MTTEGERPLGDEFDLAKAIEKDLKNWFSLMNEKQKPKKDFPLAWLAQKLVEAGWVRPTAENRFRLGGDMSVAGNTLYAQLNNSNAYIIPRDSELVLTKLAPDNKGVRDLQNGRKL